MNVKLLTILCVNFLDEFTNNFMLQELLGTDFVPKVNFSENHKVRFEDIDEITEF